MENENIARKTMDYIEENLDQGLHLDEIADAMNYSKFHLNRMFSEKVGCTIHKYIQNRRLTEAANKLVQSSKPIIDIAIEAKYNSQQSFTFAFKKMYYTTPQVYRTRGIYRLKQNQFSMSYRRAFHSGSIIQYGVIAS